MDDLISKLSEIRSDYNCFNEDEEPQYRALSEAIRILSQRADGDTISRQAAIDALDKRFDDVPMELTTEILQLRRDLRERIPSAQPATNCSEIPNGSDDTISRQAAIDCVTCDVEHTIGCLKALPPAAPTTAPTTETTAPTTDDWITVGRELPDDLAEVNVTWVNHGPEPYRGGDVE